MLLLCYHVCVCGGFPGGSVVKNLPANAGDVGSIPGSGRYPGVGNGNPLQYSCLENFMDRGAWWTTVHGAAELDRTERLHTHVCVLFHLAYLRVHYLQFFCVQPIVDPLTFGTDWLFWQGHSLFPGVMLQIYPWSPSVLSFAILGFLKTDYHCWKWLNLDDPWQVLFHGIVNRAFESV